MLLYIFTDTSPTRISKISDSFRKTTYTSTTSSTLGTTTYIIYNRVVYITELFLTESGIYKENGSTIIFKKEPIYRKVTIAYFKNYL